MTPEQILRHFDFASYWSGGCGLDLRGAYESALGVRELRIARGEQPRGFKLGFTDRALWPRYGLSAPIWGVVWNTTLSFREDAVGEALLGATCEPRLGATCVLSMASAPGARSSLDDLLPCVEWIAPGLEIVDAHLPGWKLTAEDAVADGALHARLLVGPRVPASAVAPGAAAFEQHFSQMQVRLWQERRLIDEGSGALALDGPLHALQHLVQALGDCPRAPQLQPGDVVATGTWTEVWPVTPGEIWSTEFAAPLTGLAIHLR